MPRPSAEAWFLGREGSARRAFLSRLGITARPPADPPRDERPRRSRARRRAPIPGPPDLLREDLVRPEPGERVFRHGALGTFVLWCMLVAPLPAAFLIREPLLEAARALPWVVWLVVGPALLLAGLVYFLCLYATAQVVQRALLPANWLLRISPAGLVLKLRSYQNAHFPQDGPTVARLAWAEIAATRQVRERAEHGLGDGGRVTTPWLELELRGGTEELARFLAHERERPAPQRSVLGMKGRMRSGHVPVFVARDGVVRVEWLGNRVLRALASHVTIDEPRRHELAGAAEGTALDLDARVLALCRRGQRLAAIDLARRELGLSLVRAREHVERVAAEAA